MSPPESERIHVPTDREVRQGKHYERGAHQLRITAEIDKEGEARTLELTPLAREELEAIAPDGGLILRS